jgi:methylmalonyl-CoA mutase N-terminal domain/subunit
MCTVRRTLKGPIPAYDNTNSLHINALDEGATIRSKTSVRCAQRTHREDIARIVAGGSVCPRVTP